MSRPEWFKLFRRDARILDTDILSMESRGKLITNALRYFDEAELLPMTPVEEMAFIVLKRSIDDSVAEYDHRVRVNSENGSKGGRPPKAKKPIAFLETDCDRREDRREEKIEENTEERIGKESKERKIDSLDLLKRRLYG